MLLDPALNQVSWRAMQASYKDEQMFSTLLVNEENNKNLTRSPGETPE